MATPTKLVLSLHNGKSAQPLKQGQPNLVKVHAGEHYHVLNNVDGHARPAADVLAKRHGNDLQLDYADGTQVVLQDYYVACQGALACDLTLPAADGGSHVVTGDAAGAPLGDGDTLVYAYGSHDTLMAMAQDDSALGAVLGGLHGSEISYGAGAAGLSQMGASGAAGDTGSGGGSDAGGHFGLSPYTALGLIGGGAFVVSASGGGPNRDISHDAGRGAGSDGSAPGAHHAISGTIVAGPVIAGNDLTVNLYQADGTTQIGSAKVDASGHYSIDVADYSGVVIARVANGSAPDYMDEATGQAHNLTGDLMAVGMATGDTLTLNINPLTTMAALKAGALFDGVSATSLTERTATDSNQGVAAAFGLTDLIGSDVVTTIAADGAANPNFTPADLSNAEKYGALLAALSGAEAANAAAGGTLQDTIESVLAGIPGTGVDAILSADASDIVLGGAVAAGARSGKTGAGSLTDVVSDVLARNSTMITLDTVAGDNVIGSNDTDLRLTGTVAAGATVDLIIGGTPRSVTIDGTHWSYSLTPTDIAAMGQGAATLAPVAHLGDASESARRSILIDTVAPAALISDSPLAADGTITYTINLTEPAVGFDASDIAVTEGATKGAFTAVGQTQYTLVVTPAAGGDNTTTFLNIAAGSFTDLRGNPNAAASSEPKDLHSAILLSDIAAGKGNGFVIRGESGDDMSGYSIAAAGDVNGDGLADLIIGAPHNDANGSDAGRAYVVFGKADHTAVELSDIAAGHGGFVISGGSSNTQLGASVATAGDWNGDGLADLFIGAPLALGSSGKTHGGRAYIIYGKTDTGAVNVGSLGSAGTSFNGNVNDAHYGTAVAALGDTTGDGSTDLAFGSPVLDSNATDAGRAFVVVGSTSGTVDSSKATFENYIGANAGDNVGGQLAAAGDFNGDGLADVLIGLPGYDFNGATSIGRAYLVFGRANPWAPGSTNSSTVNLNDAGVSALGAIAIDGVSVGDSAGFSTAGVGDINGDGLADLIIGAPGADVGDRPDAGRAYVVFGRTDKTDIALSDIANGNGGFVINGQSAGDAAGYQVAAAGDINGDGLADMLVSANMADARGVVDAGRTYVVFGTASHAPVDLSAVEAGHGGFVINGQSTSDWSGSSVAAAGDINGDGIGDLIVSSYLANVNGVSNVGKTYVIFGSSTSAFMDSRVDNGGTSGDDVITGTAASETLLGGLGNDTLIGHGGNDVLSGGAGNDTIVLNADNVAALSHGFASGDTQIAHVDGGTGIDTLMLDGAGISLDLTHIANAGLAAGSSASRINSIERIDLTGSGANTLTLGIADVTDLSGMNVFNSSWVDGGSSTVLGATEKRHQVLIDGNGDDAVNITGKWTLAGQVMHDGHSYDVYTSNSYVAGSSTITTYGELIIDHSITTHVLG